MQNQLLILCGLSLVALTSNAVKYDPDDLAKKIVKQTHELEVKMFERIPDMIDCERQTWMTDCPIINHYLKKNPGAPIRISTADGVTHSFDPLTPPAILNAMLDPDSQESAKMVVKYKASLDKMNSQTGATLNETYARLGTNNASGIDYQELSVKRNTVEGADLSGLILTVFVSQQEPSSTSYLKTIEHIKANSSGLKVQVLTVNSDIDWQRRHVIPLKLDVKQTVSVSKSKEFGVTKFPTTIIKNTKLKSKNTINFVGHNTKSQLSLRIKSALLLGQEHE